MGARTRRTTGRHTPQRGIPAVTAPVAAIPDQCQEEAPMTIPVPPPTAAALDDHLEMAERARRRERETAGNIAPLEEEIRRRMSAGDEQRDKAADLMRQAAEANAAADREFAAAEEAGGRLNAVRAEAAGHQQTAVYHEAKIQEAVNQGHQDPAQRRAQQQEAQSGQSPLDGPSSVQWNPSITQPFPESAQAEPAFQGGQK